MDLLHNLTILVPLILSLSVHEWAHAYSAHRLGDDTAARMGRLTLNPLVHIDPFGTVLLPLMGVPFGWAKPVPVNPARFTRKFNMRTGMMITAAAGPFSNLVLAFVCVLVMGLMQRFDLHNDAVEVLLAMGFRLNVALALFNMLPIPPLDGSRVAEGVMPVRLRPLWERFARVGPLALLAVIFLPSYLPAPYRFNLLSWPMQHMQNLAISLLQAMQGA
jgi:Zn-dependent protease